MKDNETIKEGDVFLVDWVDSRQYTGPEQLFPREIEKEFLMTSVGHVVKNADSYIALALTKIPTGKEFEYRQISVIPWCSIKSFGIIRKCTTTKQSSIARAPKEGE